MKKSIFDDGAKAQEEAKPGYWFLVPKFGKRPGDEQNTPQWWFNWFFIHIWTLDSFEVLDFDLWFDTRGIGFSVQVTWVRVRVWLIEFPRPIENWLYRHLWRKPKREMAACRKRD